VDQLTRRMASRAMRWPGRSDERAAEANLTVPSSASRLAPAATVSCRDAKPFQSLAQLLSTSGPSTPSKIPQYQRQGCVGSRTRRTKPRPMCPTAFSLAGR
jgi:hypothetical protein